MTEAAAKTKKTSKKKSVPKFPNASKAWDIKMVPTPHVPKPTRTPALPAETLKAERERVLSTLLLWLDSNYKQHDPEDYTPDLSNPDAVFGVLELAIARAIRANIVRVVGELD